MVGAVPCFKGKRGEAFWNGPKRFGAASLRSYRKAREP
jgi:hypothetical protein